MEAISFSELKVRQSKGEKLLVDFFATWCGPCKMLMPRLEQMGKSYENVSFVKLDIEQNMDAVAEYGIFSVPTVLIFDGDSLKSKSVGINSDDFYKNILDQL